MIAFQQQNGVSARLKATKANQVPTRIQPKSRHEKGQYRGDEEVRPPVPAHGIMLKPRRWIAGKISEILGSEDDVVIELCFNLLEGARYVSTNGHTESFNG